MGLDGVHVSSEGSAVTIPTVQPFYMDTFYKGTMDSWCPLNTLTSHTFPNTLPQSGMVSILAADGAKDNPRPLFPRLLPRCVWDFSMLSLARPALKTLQTKQGGQIVMK